MLCSHGLKLFVYTSLPKADTVNFAVTFCTFVLVPDTSKMIFLVLLSYWMFILFTTIEALLRHALNPDVWRIPSATTPAGRAPRRRKGSKEERGRDLMAVMLNVKAMVSNGRR